MQNKICSYISLKILLQNIKIYLVPVYFYSHLLRSEILKNFIEFSRLFILYTNKLFFQVWFNQKIVFVYEKLISFIFIYIIFSVLPANGPQITGEKKQYQIGDELNLNCSSGRSYPASVLNWYINETPVSLLIVYLKIFTRSFKINS